LPYGKGEIKRQGKGVAILAFGTMMYPALEAAESLNATVVNMRWVKPLDTKLLFEVAAQHDGLVTIEEGAVMGGAGSAVLEALQEAGVLKPVLQLGLQDEFIEHGDPSKLLALQGLDAAGIQTAITNRFSTLLDTARPALKAVA
jgi:1-deoxy-D-xylulose-5-phosphate synthase